MRTSTEKLTATIANLNHAYVEILSFEGERAIVLFEDESLKSISIHDLDAVSHEKIYTI